MKKTILWLSVALLLACTPRTGRAFSWRTDLPEAAADARQDRKFLLLNFSGSDWCGWCKRLDAEVFSTTAFQDYAASDLVCVLADFPRSKELDPALRSRNERLMRHFRVEGFPSILLFSPDGELIDKLGYQPGGPDAFIRAIQQARSRHLMRNPGLPPGPKLPPE